MTVESMIARAPQPTTVTLASGDILDRLVYEFAEANNIQVSST